MAFIDLTGQVFERLTVLAFAGKHGRGQSLFLCRCICGTEKVVPAKGLRSGESRSCGCLQREHAARQALKNKYKDGRCSLREYWLWWGVKERCLNTSDKSYPRYGGRGITICARWLESFENFYADMGECPPGLTLERKDNALGYSPENCVWATYTQQARNTRRNRILTLDGVSKSLVEWSESTGLPYSALHDRLVRGWDDRRTLTTPIMRKG
jgi:hypothetical protein